VNSDPAVLKFTLKAGENYPDYLSRFNENKKIPSISPPEHPPIHLAYVNLQGFTQSGFCFQDSMKEEVEISLYRREEEWEKNEKEKIRSRETEKERKERERVELEELWLERAVESMKLGEKSLFACFWNKNWSEKEMEREREKERLKKEKEREEEKKKNGGKEVYNPLWDMEDGNFPPIDPPPPRFYLLSYLRVEREFNPEEVNEEDKFIYAETRKQRAKASLERKQPHSALIQLNKGVTALEHISTLAVPVEAGDKIKEAQAAMYAIRSAVRSQVKDYRGAVEDCTKYLDWDTKALKILFRRGEASRLCGNYFEAKRDFEQIIALWKENEKEKKEKQTKEKEKEKTGESHESAMENESNQRIVVLEEEKQDKNTAAATAVVPSVAPVVVENESEVEGASIEDRLRAEEYDRQMAKLREEKEKEKELAESKIKDLAEKSLKVTIEAEKAEQKKAGKKWGGWMGLLNGQDEEDQWTEADEKEYQRMREKINPQAVKKEKEQELKRRKKNNDKQAKEEEEEEEEDEEDQKKKPEKKDEDELEPMSMWQMIKEIILFLFRAWCSSNKAMVEEEKKDQKQLEKELQQLKEQQAKTGNDKEKAE
jgi:hypothetical protein